MLSKSSKWDLGFVHFIAQFTISIFIILRFECTPNKLSVNINDLCLSYLSGDILKKILFFPCHFFNHFLCRNYYLSNYIGIPSIYTWGKFFLEISTFQVGSILYKKFHRILLSR